MKATVFLGLALIGIVALLVYVLGSPISPIPSDIPVSESQGIEYRIVEIEGMPCVVVESKTYLGYRVASVSCDWLKHKEQ